MQRPNEVSVWKQVIERHGGEVEPQYCTRATHVLAITQKHPTVVQALREGKRCVSAHWLSDVVSKQQVLPPWHALHFPTPFSLTEFPCVKQIVSLSGFEGDERAKVKYMLEALGAKYTNYFSRHNTLLICRRYVCICICIVYIKLILQNLLVFFLCDYSMNTKILDQMDRNIKKRANGKPML